MWLIVCGKANPWSWCELSRLMRKKENRPSNSWQSSSMFCTYSSTLANKHVTLLLLCKNEVVLLLLLLLESFYFYYASRLSHINLFFLVFRISFQWRKIFTNYTNWIMLLMNNENELDVRQSSQSKTMTLYNYTLNTDAITSRSHIRDARSFLTSSMSVMVSVN